MTSCSWHGSSLASTCPWQLWLYSSCHLVVGWLRALSLQVPQCQGQSRSLSQRTLRGQSEDKASGGPHLLLAQPILQVVTCGAPREHQERMSTVRHRTFPWRKLNPNLTIYRVVCGSSTCGSQAIPCHGGQSDPTRWKWKGRRGPAFVQAC